MGDWFTGSSDGGSGGGGWFSGGSGSSGGTDGVRKRIEQQYGGGSNAIADAIKSGAPADNSKPANTDSNLQKVGHVFAGIGRFGKNAAVSVKNDAVDAWQGLGDVGRGTLGAQGIERNTQLITDRNKQYHDQFGGATDEQWKDPAFQAKAKEFAKGTQALLDSTAKDNQQSNEDIKISSKVDAKKVAVASASTFLNATGAYGLVEGLGKTIAGQGAKLIGEQAAKETAKQVLKTGGTDALEQLVKAGGEASAKRGAIEAAKIGGEQVAKSTAQKVAASVGEGALFGGGYGALEGVKGDHVTPGGVFKNAAIGTVSGGVLSGGGELLNAGLAKVLGRGAGESLNELNHIKAENEQKLLAAGEVKGTGNTSETVIPGRPAEPNTTKLSAEDYTKQFNDLNKSYDAATKAAEAEKSPIKQRTLADAAHDEHLQALEKLNDQYIHGVPNPNAATATADKTVQTGFQIVSPEQQAAATDLKGPRQDAHIRTSQIDNIIKDAQTNGSNRTPDELRALMRERAGLQDFLDGKAPKPTSTYSPGEAYKPGTGIDNLHQTRSSGDTVSKVVANEPGNSIVGQVPTAAVGDNKAAPLARNFVIGKYQQLNDAVQKEGSKLSAGDVALIDKIEGGHLNSTDAAAHLESVAKDAKDPEQFKKVVNLMREGYDSRLASDTTLGRDVGKRNNYLPHYFDRSNPGTANTLDELSAARDQTHMTNSTKPGYTKERTFNSYAEADAYAKSTGKPLARQNANALQDFEQAMNGASYEHGSQALQKALEEAHPGQVQVGNIGPASDGQKYDQLKIAGGDNLSMPKDLAAQYNARAPYEYKDGNVGKFLKAYDEVNGDIKYGKLGGGFFHAVTTTGTTAGQQLTSLNLFKHPVDNLRLIAGTLSEKAHAANFEKLANDGASTGSSNNLSTIDRFTLHGGTLAANDIKADASGNLADKLSGAKDSVLNNKYNPIRAIHDMVFGRQIPEAKLLIFRQATQGLDEQIPAEAAKMRQVATAVNNIGGINRAVDGMSPSTAKQASRVLLATDFTEGKLRTLYAAIAKGGPEGKIARQMVVGKSIVFALPGVAAAVLSGKVNLNDPGQLAAEVGRQIVDPNIPIDSRSAPSKTNPQGTPQSAHLPSTFISEITKIIKPALDPLSTNKAQGVIDYAKARGAALPVLGGELATNKDFHGDPIYGQDKNGHPISAAKSALNIGGQVAPIPVVQGSKTASGQQNGLTAGLNIAGFHVKSDPNSTEAARTKTTSDFYNTYNPVKTRRDQASREIQTLLNPPGGGPGEPQKAIRVAEEFNQSIKPAFNGYYQKYGDNPGKEQFWNDMLNSLPISASPKSFNNREKQYQKSHKVVN